MNGEPSGLSVQVITLWMLVKFIALVALWATFRNIFRRGSCFVSVWRDSDSAEGGVVLEIGLANLRLGFVVRSKDGKVQKLCLDISVQRNLKKGN